VYAKFVKLLIDDGGDEFWFSACIAAWNSHLSISLKQNMLLSLLSMYLCGWLQYCSMCLVIYYWDRSCRWCIGDM